jgi:nucleoid DNA-binding protein
MIASVEDALVAGEKVVLVGFGTFEVKTECRKKRQKSSNQGRNYYTCFQGTRF